MNSNWSDDELRQALARSWAQHETRAPDFTTVWSAAGRQARRERRQRIDLTLAVIGLVAVAGILSRLHWGGASGPALMLGGESDGLPWQTLLLASDWQSPTDGLLQMNLTAWAHPPGPAENGTLPLRATAN